MSEENTQTTLRDALTASFDEIEAGGPSIPEIQENAPTVEQSDTAKPRDDQGKFVEKATTTDSQLDENQEKPAIRRPTTWKKEYLPMWDKLQSGQPLTPEESSKLAAYSQQREDEYKTGVSTYKAEADQARHIQEAIAPFMSDLQQHNIPVTQWIQNLGNAHKTLALGSPEQKLQMFAKLAQDYGIPLDMVAHSANGGQVDNTTMQLMQEIQNLKSQVSGVNGWKEQQEQYQIQQQLSQFTDTSKYPHFEMVRGTMAQLLENGKAQDLKTAYDMAAEPIEEMIKQRLEQAGANHSQSNQQAVAQAKAKAVSPKSSTPSGQVKTTEAKDRRAMLAEQVDALMGAGRV